MDCHLFMISTFDEMVHHYEYIGLTQSFVEASRLPLNKSAEYSEEYVVSYRPSMLSVYLPARICLLYLQLVTHVAECSGILLAIFRHYILQLKKNYGYFILQMCSAHAWTEVINNIVTEKST